MLRPGVAHRRPIKNDLRPGVYSQGGGRRHSGSRKGRRDADKMRVPEYERSKPHTVRKDNHKCRKNSILALVR
eukprot:8741674-Alexandrium_andersonii.AAC.1